MEEVKSKVFVFAIFLFMFFPGNAIANRDDAVIEEGSAFKVVNGQGEIGDIEFNDDGVLVTVPAPYPIEDTNFTSIDSFNRFNEAESRIMKKIMETYLERMGKCSWDKRSDINFFAENGKEVVLCVKETNKWYFTAIDDTYLALIRALEKAYRGSVVKRTLHTKLAILYSANPVIQDARQKQVEYVFGYEMLANALSDKEYTVDRSSEIGVRFSDERVHEMVSSWLKGSQDARLEARRIGEVMERKAKCITSSK